MSTFAYFQSATYTGLIQTLAIDDDVYVGPFAHLVSKAGTAFVANGSGHSFVIDGSVEGAFRALQLGSGKYDVNQVLVVHDGAEVVGGYYGATLTGTHSWVSNAGLIKGEFTGLEFNGIGAGTQSTLNNTGAIVGHEAVTRYSAASTETLVINNSGNIIGYGASFHAMGSNAVEKITNTGVMTGSAYMGGGNDLFDTSKGAFANGWIFMDAGDDTVRGSAASDGIVGGAGKDLITGNGGADSFIFWLVDSAASKAGADRITDFSHAQHDKIDLLHLDAIISTAADDVLHWIGTQAFHHKAGELNYSVANGNAFVQADVNGDGASDFTIRLDHVTSLVQGDFVL